MHYLSDNQQNGFDTWAVNKNLLVFSTLKEFYHSVKSNNFAIRYSVDGLERYELNGHIHDVHKGTYLLSNGYTEGWVEVESVKKVKSICLGITDELISEVVAAIIEPNTPYSDSDLGGFFNSSQFLENIYPTQNTQLGHWLLNLNTAIHQGNFKPNDVDFEFFYAICENLVADHIPIFKQLQAIPSIKSATKKELFKRISKGKDFIDSAFLTPLTIDMVAREACMSEYHFFRLFKAVFGLSPHQYILKKRLEYGNTILKQDKIAVSDAAFEAGFTDIFTFSKAFKKHFGYTPSSLLK